jgi:4-hydroxybutyrate CoA-transferase
MAGSLRPVAPDHALRRLPEHATLIASPGCSTPGTLLRALGEYAHHRPGLTLSAGLLLGDLPFLDAVRAGQMGFRTWHVPKAARQAASEGLVDYVPVRASEVPSMFRSGFDCALVRVSAPDRRGYVSHGPSLSYTREAVDASRMVIAEVDPTLPRTCGDTEVHLSRFDAVIETEEPMREYAGSPAGEAARRVAANVAELLTGGPVLQLGIGAVPEALIDLLDSTTLAGTRFAGMVTERMAERLTATAGDRRGPVMCAVELMGGARLMEIADRNPAIRMVGSVLGHDALRLSADDGLTSVNSALAVDLSGQVAAEAIGGRVIGGIGGSVDFFDAARMSSRGERIVALQAETPDGRSTIVPELPPATPVTIARHLVDIVVTEHGAARLAGGSLRERAEALAAVAAPRHRAALRT